MKLAYVCADPGIPLRGVKGASHHVRSITSGLAADGHDVLLACARLDGPNEAPHVSDIVRLEGDAGSLSDRLSGWGCEAVIERYALAGDAASDAAARLALPYVLEVNSPLVDEATRFRALDDPERWRRRERRLFARADRVIVVSTALRQHVIEAGGDPDRTRVIPNGVDQSLFTTRGGSRIRNRWGLGTGLVVGFIGSLKPWHGVHRLLDAGRPLAEPARLLIVGEGPEREALERFAQAEDALRGRVVFTGAVTHAEIAPHLDAIDIAVAPYEPMSDFYFSPLKVVEYMAAGRAIVASRQGDLPDLLGDSAMLVEAGDTGALTAALKQLAGDPSLRRRLGIEARLRARGLTWAAVARRVVEVIRDLPMTAVAT